jgi:hypothetical protein
MTDERWHFLMSDAAWERVEPLTPDEIAEGWHFCWDWDGLLIGPGMGEMQSCCCNTVNSKNQV